MKVKSANDLKELQKSIASEKSKVERQILVCGGTGCLANGSKKIAEALKDTLKKEGIDVDVKLNIKLTGCHGFCERGPLVVILPEEIFYQRVKLNDIPKIVEETVKNGNVIDKLLYKDPKTKTKIEKYNDIEFYNKQKRIALKNIGKIDPMDIREYIEMDGYQALAKALVMDSDDVISAVDKAGLRGRGGGGFSVARKWRSCKKATGDIRYIICNGDEGDPGAFMDRSIMEGDPHAVLEGMIIGAYAIGSSEGYIYVREEYPLALKSLYKAIDEARTYGFIGENILGTDFSFDIKINRGGGAFVCGESSALMQSIAGNVGEPRAKYIHSTDKGLYDQPTVLNNVESWACVPQIIYKGADWFASVGTERSKGTKVFSLVGKVNNTGLVEVPMGATLREIIFGVGGGIPNDRPFKAVQTGGPSGGCLPESHLDLPVDFDTLTKAGSMMGSGGMIVMDNRTCMVDVAKYFLKFLTEESCGKCVPCREGLWQMYHILDDITKGKGKPSDLDKIERLGKAIEDASLCALGKSGPFPVMSTIRYFREEYEEHINDKKCRAGVCKELSVYMINDKCTGCMLCAKKCPTEAISGEKKQKHTINQEKCIKCGICYDVCKFDAVSIS